MSSNNISGEEDGSFSSGNTTTVEQVHQENEEKQQLQNYPHGSNSEPSSHGACNNSNNNNQPQATKKKRNLPGTPDPNAEVIALSPRTLMARNRFVCEICKKGFQRDQNLQLHRRGHNLPWKLRQRAEAKKKRVYVCPEEACVHHNPARALGDLTGIKKHYSRKHCEKKWKCDKCSKTYAVQSDWKAHLKTCGTRDYKCDCGTIFSRRDSFITHRAFCDALTEENNRVNNQQGLTNGIPQNLQNEVPDLMTTMTTMPLSTSSISNPASDQIINNSNNNNNYDLNRNNPLRTLSQEIVPSMQFKSMNNIIGGGMFSTTTSSSSTLFGGPKTVPCSSSSSLQLSTNNSSGFNYFQQQDCKNNNLALISGSAHMSATALLQKAAQMGATASNNSINSPLMQKSFVTTMAGPDQVSSPRPPPPYNNPSSYDHFHAQKHDQSHMPFTNQQFFHKGQQEMPMIFDANNNSSNNNGSTMNDQMGMFSTMFMGSNHSNTGLMKDNNNNVEQDAGTNAHGRDIAEGNNQMGSVPMFGGSDDMTTVHDFLGIGGSTPRGGGSGLHQSQKHHHQQQRMELDALSHQRLPFVNHFHQHRLQHGDSAMEKSVWGHLC